MYYVYILLLSNGRLYAGATNNLNRRLREHTSSKSPFTKNRLPVKLIFIEAFMVKSDTERRERYFKTNKGKSTIKLMLRDILIRVK